MAVIGPNACGFAGNVVDAAGILTAVVLTGWDVYAELWGGVLYDGELRLR